MTTWRSDADGRDGGWAWMCCLGGFFINVLSIGQLKTFGIMQLELMKVFDSGVALTAWVNGLAYAMTFGLAPFASILSNKYGHRQVIIAGGLLAGLGLSSSYFATTLTAMYISYGVAFGAGCGLSVSPSISILGVYFRKRISIGSGLVICGTGVGSLLFPYLTEFLLQQYNIGGTFLVCGAVTLNIVAAGALMRPLSATVAPPSEKIPPREGAGDGVDTVGFCDDDAETLSSGVVVCIESHTAPQCSDGATVACKDGARAKDGAAAITFPWHLLKDAGFILFALSLTLFMFAYLSIYQLMPLITDKLGDGSISGATMIAFMSIAETICRVLWGVVWDHGVFRKPNVRMIGIGILLSLSGGLVFACIFITVNELLAGWTMVTGVLAAGVLSTFIPITMDIAGPTQVGNGYSIVMVGQGAVMAVGPLFTGYLVDTTGSVDSALYLLSASFILGGIFVGVIPLVRRCRHPETEISSTETDYSDDNLQGNTTNVKIFAEVSYLDNDRFLSTRL